MMERIRVHPGEQHRDPGSEIFSVQLWMKIRNYLYDF